MDQIDQLIIEELKKNARISMKELGEKVHLTGQAVSARVRRLEEDGVIEAYTVRVNDAATSYPIHAILTIYTRDYYHQPYLSFVNAQQEYVLHNYKVSGEGCYLLECRFPSNEILDEFLVKLNQHVNYKLTLVVRDMVKREDFKF